MKIDNMILCVPDAGPALRFHHRRAARTIGVAASQMAGAAIFSKKCASERIVENNLQLRSATRLLT